MSCTECGAEVAQGLKFCTSCGTPVTIACPGCGEQATPDARFCGHCGTALQTAPPAAPAAPTTTPVTAPAPVTRERKVATILFADLVGFTALGESQDPEVVQALVTRAFDRLAAEVDRHEGLIEKFAGDAMLAVFGVPAVHEDDAERAVRAALAMQRAMGLLADELRAEGHAPLQLRIGIESGEVLVDQARAAGERDRMVTGDPVNTAARLQQSAEPDQIVAGAAVRSATQHVAEFEPMPPLRLKGKGASVLAWRVLGLLDPGATAQGWTTAALVGRASELAILEDILHRTVDEHRPHLVTLLGAPGVGKSRLVAELRRRCEASPLGFVWRTGAALAYGQPSYGPLAQIVMADAGIREDDATAVADEHLRQRVAAFGRGDAHLSALQALIAGDRGDQHVGDRSALFEQWQAHLEGIAEQAPLALVLEDLHWADEGTIDFVESLAHWGRGPIAIIVVSRSLLTDRRPGWGGGIGNTNTIALEPLEPREAGELAHELVGPDVPNALRDQLVEVAGGNPLFLEELVASLVDRGVLVAEDGAYRLDGTPDTVVVPDSINAVLAARLDSLDAADKRVLQTAAVVGRDFWVGAVAELDGSGWDQTRAALRRLRARGFVTPTESTLSEQEQYTFRHALLRDVAYRTLPKALRAEKHAAVARWAHRSLGDRDDVVAEVLATHLLDAFHYAQATGQSDSAVELVELRRDAYRLARRAGDRTRSLGQVSETTRWVSRARDLADGLQLPPHERLQLDATYAEAAQHTEDRATLIADLEAAIERARAAGADDDLHLARLHYVLARTLVNMGEVDSARRWLREQLDRSAAGPSTARSMLLRALGGSYWRMGPAEEAEPLVLAALDEARAVADAEAERWAIHELGLALYFTDRADEGAEKMLESLALARRDSDHRLLHRCYTNLTAVLGGTSHWREARDIGIEGMRRAQRGLDHDTMGSLSGNLANPLTDAGELDAAREVLDQGLSAAEHLRDVQGMAALRFQLGWCAYCRGQHDQAAEWLRRSRATGALEEHQNRGWATLLSLMLRWDDDPRGAVGDLGARLLDADGMIRDARQMGTFMWSRMAVRANDRHHPAWDAVLHEAADPGGGARAPLAHWAGLLADQHDPGVVGRLLDLVPVIEDGRGLWAPELRADIALLSTRHALDDAAEHLAAARSAFETAGRPPMLSPLPAIPA